jgi:competence protein ComEC
VTLDVGQGDALALACGRSWWLLDAGPRAPGYDAGESVVLPFFRWAGVRRLEWLLLTHHDSDHAGGADAVLRGMRVEHAGLSPRHAARMPGLGREARALARGDSLRSHPPVVVLWPPAGLVGASDNAAGLVIEVGSGGGRALFMADVDSTVEDSLDLVPGVLILKAGHHGAPSSTGTRFLQRARPAVAVISAGARNRHGHPAPAVLERLAASGVRVRRTDLEGALWLEWSAAGVRDVDWRSGEPRRGGGTRTVRPAPCPGVHAPMRR